MLEKQNKKIRLTDLYPNDFTGNIDEIISMLEECKEDGYNEITVENDLYGDEDGVAGEYIVWGCRMETDEELTERQQLIAKKELDKYIAEQNKIEKEKQLYQELKEKYES